MIDIEEKRGRGRPRKGDGNDFRLDVRISKREKDILEYISSVEGETMSDIVRKAIREYANYKEGCENIE